MFLIEGSNFFRRIFLENFLRGDALAGGCPHIGDIEIIVTGAVIGAAAVVVEPADTHARADIFDSCLRGNISKGSVPVVAVKIFSAEIIYHVEVGPTVAVVVAPSAAETVARVVPVQARLGGDVAEGSVALVAHHEVGRAVLGIVIGNGIFVLIGSLVIDIEAKINVEPAVTVVVGDGSAGESSLRRVGEMKRIGLLAKLSAALVEEQKRAVRAHNYNVLASVVVEVGKKSAGGVFEDAQAGCFRDVLERSISAISIKTVGQARGLADIEIVEAVVIDIGDGDSIVPVDIDAAGAVEHCAPVVSPAQQLRRIRGVAAENGSSNVHKDWRSGTTLGLVEDPPAAHAEFTG